MFAFPLVVTVTTFDVGVDDYGNPVPSGSSSATARGDYQPLRAEERDGVDFTDLEEFRFYLEPSAVVSSSSTLTVNGVTFHVVGPPEARVYGSPLDHVRCRARRAG